MCARTLLAGGLLNLVGGTDADQTVVRLELLQGLLGVVDQSEAGALATTVLCAETEDGDLVLVGLVQVGQLLPELILGDVGAVGVEDVPGNTEMSVARFFQCDFLCSEKCVRGVGVVLPCPHFCVCMCACFGSILDRQSSNFSSIGGKERESLHDHLLAGKQRVADELASPQSNGSVGHFGGEW